MNRYPEAEDSALLCRVRRVEFPDGSVEVVGRFLQLRVLGGGPSHPRKISAEERTALHRRIAERHARRSLRWSLMSIEADRILTVTYRENMVDLARARADWKAFVRLVRARYPEWLYVVVLERQERGAIHFHAGVKGWQDVKALRSAWLRVVAGGAGCGNVDVTSPKRRFGTETESSSVRRIASYLAKYLGKAFDWMPKGSRRFVASEDRPRPVIARWWLEVGEKKGRVIELLYRAACGVSAVEVGHWLSRDGEFYSVWCDGPPQREECPF